MRPRPERSGDAEPIRHLTRAAFEGVPCASGTEAAIIDALRAADALTLSLVVEEGGEVVGHVAFSPVTVGGDRAGWHALGPVSVRPARQRGGIGSALIREGLGRLEGLGTRGCVLLGDPRYYGRFGFASDPRLTYRGASTPYLQRLVFAPPAPKGEVEFHAAFDAG